MARSLIAVYAEAPFDVLLIDGVCQLLGASTLHAVTTNEFARHLLICTLGVVASDRPSSLFTLDQERGLISTSITPIILVTHDQHSLQHAPWAVRAIPSDQTSIKTVLRRMIEEDDLGPFISLIRARAVPTALKRALLSAFSASSPFRTVTELARHCGLDRRTLSRAWRSASEPGSPQRLEDVLHALQLERVCDLVEGGLALIDACHVTGISTATFHRRAREWPNEPLTVRSCRQRLLTQLTQTLRCA
jgi:DNA-binding phage protein